MLNEFTRMEMLVGDEGIRKLSSARIAVFGLGGVGSYVAEALARCGQSDVGGSRYSICDKY